MELKNYQQAILERLSFYLKRLKETEQNALVLSQSTKKRGLPVCWSSDPLNFCKRAWQSLNEKNQIPPFSKKQENMFSSEQESIFSAEQENVFSSEQENITTFYKNRISGADRPVPNICLKVPTGGGKTLLAACGVERINTDFFEANTGFVLWVVPSDSIYRQTLKALSDRGSLYRQVLDRTSAGKVKILQKKRCFSSFGCEKFFMCNAVNAPECRKTVKRDFKNIQGFWRVPVFFS